MDNSERVNKFGLVMLGLAGFGLAGDQRISGVNFGFTGGISLGGLGGSYSNGDQYHGDYQGRWGDHDRVRDYSRDRNIGAQYYNTFHGNAYNGAYTGLSNAGYGVYNGAYTGLNVANGLNVGIHNAPYNGVNYNGNNFWNGINIIPNFVNIPSPISNGYNGYNGNIGYSGAYNVPYTNYPELKSTYVPGVPNRIRQQRFTSVYDAFDNLPDNHYDYYKYPKYYSGYFDDNKGAYYTYDPARGFIPYYPDTSTNFVAVPKGTRPPFVSYDQVDNYSKNNGWTFHKFQNKRPQLRDTQYKATPVTKDEFKQHGSNLRRDDDHFSWGSNSFGG